MCSHNGNKTPEAVTTDHFRFSRLIIFVGGKRKVLGHAKVSKVPALPGELFVESVVVHPGLRGLGLGKLLMLKVRNADNHFYHSV